MKIDTVLICLALLHCVGCVCKKTPLTGSIGGMESAYEFSNTDDNVELSYFYNGELVLSVYLEGEYIKIVRSFGEMEESNRIFTLDGTIDKWGTTTLTESVDRITLVLDADGDGFPEQEVVTIKDNGGSQVYVIESLTLERE